MKHTKFTAPDILAPLKELQKSWKEEGHETFSKIIVEDCTEEEAEAKILFDVRKYYPNYKPLEFASLKNGNTIYIIAKGKKKEEA